MGIWQIVHELVLGPIELLLDVVYAISLRFTHNYGFSIIVLSLVVNLLVLPLYRKADELQKEEQKISKRLRPRIDQIKEAFTGDERFMMLQTYYRQNNYKPYYVLRGSLSLLLQIPFFMAAYNFLSNLVVVQGVPFGPIGDLAAPDAILKLGGITVNVLPILMTLINIVSGMIYTRGMPLKSKIQLYGMAGLFLVLLYNSPSGLVLYWTMNNVFSLGKNIVERVWQRYRKPALSVRSAERKAVKASGLTPARCKGIFWFSVAFLTLLTGLVIPSEVIKSSVAEFLDIRYLLNPLRYLAHSFLHAAGFFLLWIGIYFCLSGEKRKRVFAGAFAALAVIAAVNFTFFGTTYGDISSLLRYQGAFVIENSQKWINLIVILAIVAVVLTLIRKLPGLMWAVCAASCAALLAASVMNMSAIQSGFRENEAIAKDANNQGMPEIHMSRTGKNVVVMMFDRAIGGFVPFLMNEKPELLEQFDGFTYYPNTLSFGYHTISAAPAVFGGYEYMPVRIMERANEKLVDKHNEALKVMPVLFHQNGYDVTVIDQSLANYQWIPDLSIYDDYPEIHRYNTDGVFTTDPEGTIQYSDEVRNRNLFCYSIFRILPVVLQMELYNDGKYNETDIEAKNRNIVSDEEYEEKLIRSMPDFMNEYLVMQNLSVITKIREENENCLLVMTNEETHDIRTLQEPDYVPKLADYLDNTWFEKTYGVRTAADGSTLDIGAGDIWLQRHYQCNMSTFLQLGRWFDFLRDNGVWDNTRIILVSDHGYYLGVLGLDLTEKYPELKSVPNVNDSTWTDTMAYEPLLMVKDFDAKGFTTDSSFMTNADTPTLAVNNLVDQPVNPFTGNPITSDAKYSGELYTYETDAHVETNNGYVFTDPQILVFRGNDIRNIENWSVKKQ